MKTALQSIFIVLSLSVFFACSSKSPSEPDEVDFPFQYDRNFDYLAVLKASPGYAYEYTNDLPAFTYQDSSDENLNQIRNRYNLDAVAGDGDEWSRIINLLKWVHRTIRHDGNSPSPDPENALNILDYCEETGRGVNCVAMAIVLNEVYLSMGWQSRVIHGNAKYYMYTEWHAFNIVYSKTLDKWVYVDPTFLGYYTDDDGMVMSVAEIRDNLRRDIPLHLDEDADYNGSPLSQTDNLHYLSKNFYRFACVVNSSFGGNCVFHIDDAVNQTLIYLDPANDAFKGLDGVVKYNTSNPSYFWSGP